jgi:propionyl-CoA carboxylase alpha chain
MNHNHVPTRAIYKVLVANRGEIALRIMRSCHKLGMTTVAVYSTADRDAPFVRFADEAVCIGPAPARESYLMVSKILDAIRQSGADAVHPGYGFLSENADFAQAIVDAGVVFVGPSPVVIRSLGKKREAKQLAIAAGVPVVPGYNESSQDRATMVAAADLVGFPILVKASAGGGGKGMRIVRQSSELQDAIERAQSEALAAFGDGSLILERYIDKPRHIEIQILGDTHGNLIHLWERECSIQRRHQKIIEEAPSATLSDSLREEIAAAALQLGKAVGYSSAGTVEFVVDQQGGFYFLEVNTRLQVEHPVTEETYGIDLVEQQLRIARGERLEIPSAALTRNGHSIELRWCAENPEQQFLPTTGTLLALQQLNLPGIRYDFGVEVGSTIGISYDSMLGKIIANAATRNDAIALLRRALVELWAPGLVSNREYLLSIIGHRAFVAGELHTHFVEQHAGELAAAGFGNDLLRVAAVAATLHSIDQRKRRASADQLALEPGWRNVRFSDQEIEYTIGEQTVALGYRVRGSGIEIAIAGKRLMVSCFGVTTDGSDVVWFEESGGLRHKCRVRGDGDSTWVQCGSRMLQLQQVQRFADPSTVVLTGGLKAPMPGRVIGTMVSTGDVVVAGDALVVLEAMKMEHTIRAATAGTVRNIYVSVGDQVEAGAVLALVE